MSVEERIRHLLRVASRVESEGDIRGVALLRQMAAEALPVERRDVARAVGGQSDA